MPTPTRPYIFEGLLLGRARSRDHHRPAQRLLHCNRTMRKTEATHPAARSRRANFDPDVCFLSQGCVCLGSVTLDRCMAPCMKVGVPCFCLGGPAEPIILEPQKDVRTEVAMRMAT